MSVYCIECSERMIGQGVPCLEKWVCSDARCECDGLCTKLERGA